MMSRVHDMGAGERMRVLGLLAAELARAPDVAFSYLYGSFTESEPFHDIDIGVYLSEQERGSERVHALAHRLSALLKMPVDVRTLNDAPVSFLYHVLQGKLIFSRDDELLSAVLEHTIPRYLDIAPLLHRGTKEAFAE